METFKTALRRLERHKEETVAFFCCLFLSAGTVGSAVGGGVSPFAIALLCATKTHRVPMLFGALCAFPFWNVGRGMQIFCLLLCHASLYAFEHQKPHPLRKRYAPSFQLRMLLSVLCALLTATDRILRAESIAEGILSCLLCCMIPLYTALFHSFLHKGKNYELAVLGVLFAVAQTVSPLHFGGVSAALPVGAVCTLAMARNKGFGYGCVTGLFCALPAGSGSIGALGVLGITYGLLVRSSEIFSVLLGFLIAGCGYWYLEGDATVLPALGMLLLACGLFFAFRKRFPKKAPPLASPLPTKPPALQKYAAAFSSLSGLFYTVSEQTSAEKDLSVGVSAVVASFCRNCEGCDLPERELCDCFTTLAEKGDPLQVRDVPSRFAKRCPFLPSMVRKLNRLSEKKDPDPEKGIRRMAGEYANLSSLLDNAARKEENALARDRAGEAKARRALEALHISFEAVHLTGKREKVLEVFGVSLSHISASANRITSALSETLGVRLSEPEFLMKNDYAVMKLHSVPRCRIEYAKCVSSKSGEKVCGDTVSCFETEDGYFYCLLSDGMGSGRDAALSSRLAILILEKLLSVGAEKADALQMLNKALRQKDKEVFATVDLLEIDRYSGIASLIKVGAAPTLLFRAGACRRFESKTPPAGIMREVIAERRSFPVRKGDLLVLVSDGVLQTGDGSLFARSHAPLPISNAHAAANGILTLAGERNKGADDMSVCAVKVV